MTKCGSCWHDKDAHEGWRWRCMYWSRGIQCPCKKYVEE